LKSNMWYNSALHFCETTCNAILKSILQCNFTMLFEKAILKCNFVKQFRNEILQCYFDKQQCIAILQSNLQWNSTMLFCNAVCNAILQCHFKKQPFSWLLSLSTANTWNCDVKHTVQNINRKRASKSDVQMALKHLQHGVEGKDL